MSELVIGKRVVHEATGRAGTILDTLVNCLIMNDDSGCFATYSIFQVRWDVDPVNVGWYPETALTEINSSFDVILDGASF